MIGKMQKRIEKIGSEETRAGAEVANTTDNIRELRLGWVGYDVRKYRKRCSNEKMVDRKDWTPKDRKTETEVE